MKILVIDDNPIHIASAQVFAVDHELTTAADYDEAIKLLEDKWDVVLCDLLMPAGFDKQGPIGKKFSGQEMPVGFGLALMFALRGAKYVAVATDSNHHDHPASAMFDYLGAYNSNPCFNVNGAHLGFYFTPCLDGEGKNWKNVLNKVMMRVDTNTEVSFGLKEGAREA